MVIGTNPRGSCPTWQSNDKLTEIAGSEELSLLRGTTRGDDESGADAEIFGNKSRFDEVDGL
jgi:hypothetical protein